MILNKREPKIKGWVLWTTFFIYTVAAAVLVQFVILPYLFPKAHLGHGLFVFDSGGFHEIATRKAAEIKAQGWSAWELRPKIQFPAGVASIFYYLWAPEPYSLIPWNAALHATAGYLVFFLLSTFISSRFAAASGAALFVLNPASFEWTTQIHRDGAYILGNLLVLSAWIFLAKGLSEKNRKNFLFALILTFWGAFLIWASRPYWNQVAVVSGIMSLLLILSYGIKHFKNNLHALSLMITAGLAGLLMILIQIPFLTTNLTQEAPGQTREEIKEETSSLKDFALGEIEKNFLGMDEVNTPTPSSPRLMSETEAFIKVLKIKQRDLTEWQKGLESLHDYLSHFSPDKDLDAMKNEAEKKAVLRRNYNYMSWVELEECRQDLLHWNIALKKWEIALESKKNLILGWKLTPGLPKTIENKLFGIWHYRRGTVGAGGNTVIDRYIPLNSAGAFLRYFPRALEIGFLSPFPREWFKAGSIPANTFGKRILGAIQIFFYIILFFFVWSLWNYRKYLNFWIMFIYCTIGLLVFTYVYANIGILSRMRYGFYMVIMAIGFSFTVQKLLEYKRGLKKYNKE